jgi:opacity protein-like surface antigen
VWNQFASAWQGRVAHQLAGAALAAVAALILWAGPSRSAQIIPSLGITKPVDGGGDANTYGGLAFRTALAPLLSTEVGVAYRTESRYGGNLAVRSWPVTASLYLTPVPSLYAGAGVGWYQTTFDYSSQIPLADQTSQQFGVHVGGGVQVPLASALAVDLGGRYVMMRDQSSHLVPEHFNPDFWMLSLGLAFGR